MRIVMVAIDTRGGVQPYVALGRGLALAGHDVALAATANYGPFVEAHGVGFIPLVGDTEQTVRDSGGSAEMGRAERARTVDVDMKQRTAEWAEALLAAADGADLITGGIGGTMLGRPVADRLGIPFVEAHLQPVGPATSAYRGVLVALPAWMGAPGRRLGNRITRLGVSMMTASTARRIRTRALGLPARPAPVDPRLPSVYGYSPLVVPPAPEWGPRRHVTGYWPLPPEADWSPPADLAAFLAAGPPPVCIGFGSMSSKDPAAQTATVLGAVRRAGVRAVLLSGWGGLAPSAADGGRIGARSDDAIVVDQVPHEWLFPRMAAVVHHGGAGTTGAGLRAGVPAVVVPFGVDQPFWGSRVEALGVGPRPIPRRRLTADALAAALRTAVGDPAMVERAADLGRRIRAEDGVAAAVEVYGTLA